VVHPPVGVEQQRALEDLDDLQRDVEGDGDEVAQEDDEAEELGGGMGWGGAGVGWSGFEVGWSRPVSVEGAERNEIIL
jgi:hypothetical protein